MSDQPGESIVRREDERFLTGNGKYVDDLVLPDQLYAAFVRSAHACADIGSVDCAEARRASGVVGVFTASDLDADGIGPIPCAEVPAFPGHSGMFVPDYPLLCANRVRFVGDTVALVVAATPAAAMIAAELVDVDYAPLPSVTQVSAAAACGAPLVHDQAPGNLCFSFESGDSVTTADAFARAEHVTSLRLVNNRLVPTPIEPRAALGAFDESAERFTLYTCTQIPHLTRLHLAEDVLKIPQSKLRVVVGDVGGAFGVKAPIYREQALVLWAARRLRRPVKWVALRSESFLCDTHARDMIYEAALALDGNGAMLGLRVAILANMGAYVSYYGAIPPTSGIAALVGPYRTPAIHVQVRGLFSHSVMTDAYRGAGRPEAVYALERLVDQAARELSMPPSELRRRNFIAADAIPYRTPLETVYDSGKFERNMDSAMALADWSDFAQRRASSRSRGLLRGIGMANYVERSGGGHGDTAEVAIDADGRVTALMGTMSTGQGHDTAYARIVSQALGLDPERVTVVQGDTDRVLDGRGTYGSRSLSIGGSALTVTLDKVIDKAKLIAAHELEVAPVDLELVDGRIGISGTDRSIGLAELAAIADQTVDLPPGESAGLRATALFTPPNPTFPNGCHICEVEIDPETGVIRLCGYWAVDDFGRVLNPMLVDGQMHGGIAQGLGQALQELAVYCQESGQLLSGSLMDYCLPRADDLPGFELARHEEPCASNPLGVKGCGEAGAIAAPPALMNAVLDALFELGVEHLDMPATPQNVWFAIHERS
jgi:carbon-monoxide dehydrogenase large subunit